MAKRQQSFKKRIEDLLEAGIIDVSQFHELMKRERYTRGALQVMKTKLGEHYNDFVARSYDVAQCRGRSHRWDLVPNTLSYRPITALFYETERCDRCGTVKIITVNAIGQKDRTIYQHPEDFSINGIRTTKKDWKTLVRWMQLKMDIEELEMSKPMAEESANVIAMRATNKRAKQTA